MNYVQVEEGFSPKEAKELSWLYGHRNIGRNFGIDIRYIVQDLCWELELLIVAIVGLLDGPIILHIFDYIAIKCGYLEQWQYFVQNKYFITNQEERGVIQVQLMI